MVRILFCLALVGWFCTASTASAQPLHYTITLNGPNESPPNASPGIGSGIVITDATLHTMQIQMTFTGLLGNTSAAHIHAATPTPFAGTAGVATTTPSFAGFPLGVTSGSFSNTLDMTLASSYNPSYITAHGGTTSQAEADLFASIAAGTAYFNVHSSAFPGGEIRAFMVAVPEPTTIALIGAGVLGAGLYQGRRWLKHRRNVRFAR